MDATDRGNHDIAFDHALVADRVEVAANNVRGNECGQLFEPLLQDGDKFLAPLAVHHRDRGLDDQHGMTPVAADEVTVLDRDIIPHGCGERPQLIQQEHFDPERIRA